MTCIFEFTKILPVPALSHHKSSFFLIVSVSGESPKLAAAKTALVGVREWYYHSTGGTLNTSDTLQVLERVLNES